MTADKVDFFDYEWLELWLPKLSDDERTNVRLQLN